VGVWFADKPCVDPRDVMRECFERRLPMADWVGKPTTFRTSIRTPGIGWVLLSRVDLKAIPETASHTLEMQFPALASSGATETLTIKKLWIVNSKCVTPGYEEADNAVYLCKLADYRYFLDKMPVNDGYNLRDAAGVLSGAEKTWSEMLSALWTKSSELGSFPGLPSGVAPHGKPYHFDYFSNWSIFAAIQHVCDRIGVAFVYDPFKDKYSLVRVGVSPPEWPKNAEKVWDEYILVPDNASEPKEVQTLFRKNPPIPTAPAFKKTTSRAAKSGMLNGSAVVLHDDLAGSNESDAAFTSRANDRAAEWERVRASKYHGNRLTIFAGLWNLVDTLGKRSEAIAWVDRDTDSGSSGDRGGGWTTEVKIGDTGFLEQWRPTPIVTAGGGEGVSSCCSYVMTSHVTGGTCDGMGSGVNFTVTYGVEITGCSGGLPTVSGLVTDGGDPVDGVDILATSSESDPNSFSKIATTGEDGRYSGMVDSFGIDATNPTPYFFIVVKPDATGYTPGQHKLIGAAIACGDNPDLDFSK
jgi:hypothetical protein